MTTKKQKTKNNYAYSVADKVRYIIKRYPSAVKWDYNKFVQVYYREWGEVGIPIEFLKATKIETVLRSIREVKA